MSEQDITIEIPGYRLISSLGRGGMATVYLAIQESVDRKVALKVMSPALATDPSFGDRFLREARIAAQLHHPNLIAVFDVGAFGHYHYIAMQYHAGGTLDEERMKLLSPNMAISIVSDIASALDYAHSKGFIHRDVKPDNIIFDESGKAVLSDFGIARATDSSTQMTATGSIIGTPHYMSPEQARGKKVDGRADLYSLGIMFYEMLMGSVPYKAPDTLAVCIMHVNDPIPPLPMQLAAFQPTLNKIMAKERDQRFQTGREFCAELLAVANSGKVRIPLDEPTDAERFFSAVENTPTRRVGVVTHTPQPVGMSRRPAKKRSGNWLVGITVVLLLGVGAYFGGSYVAELPKFDDRSPYERQLDAAEAAFTSGQILPSEEGSAYRIVKALLAEKPKNKLLKERLRALSKAYIRQATSYAESGDLRQAEIYLSALRTYLIDFPKQASVEVAFSNLDKRLKSQKAALSQDAGDLAQLEALLKNAAQASNIGKLFEQGGAFELYSRAKALVPDDGRAMIGFTAVLTRQKGLINEAIGNNAIESAQTHIDALEQAMPGYEGLADLKAALQQAQTSLAAQLEQEKGEKDITVQVNELLVKGQAALDKDRLSKPEDDNALYYYQAALALAPDGVAASKGVEKVAARYIALAREAESAGDFEKAEVLVARAAAISSEHPDLFVVEKTGEKPNAPISATDGTVDSLPKTVSALMVFADQALGRDDLMNAYRAYQKVLRLQPDNKVAGTSIRRGVEGFVKKGNRLIESDRLDEARKQLDLAHMLDPDNPQLQTALRRLKNKDQAGRQVTDGGQKNELQISFLMQSAQKAESELMLDPLNRQRADRTLQKFLAVLRKRPGHAEAVAGVERVAKAYLSQARVLAKHGNLIEAWAVLDKVRDFSAAHPGLAEATNEVRSYEILSQEKDRG